MEFQFEANSLHLTIPTLYSEDVLFKCFYWYTAEYGVEIESLDQDFNIVTLSSKKGAILDSVALREKIGKDLIDFKLRDIVTKETQTIRELITAKAFAHIDLTTNPSTDITDPVGFNPKDI